jgi:transcriptional regulator with XRE-family HTH domain
MADVSWGKLIAERRKTLALRQSDLAAALAYSNQAISKIENDETQLPLSALPTLCRVLKISLNDFLAKAIEVPRQESNIPPLDNALIADNIAALRSSKHLSLAEEAQYLKVSKGTLILYEKGESLPSLEGLLLLAQQSGRTPEEFLNESLNLVPPSRGKKSNKRQQILWTIGGLFLLSGIILAIVLPLTLRSSAKGEEASTSEVASEASSSAQTTSAAISSESSSSSKAFEGLTRYWLKSGDGQDGKAEISAGFNSEILVMSDPLEYFKNQETVYSFSFTLVNAPAGVLLQDGSDYLSRSLILPLSSKGSVFTITSQVSLLADSTQSFTGDVFQVTVK